jgi:ArsR family transcriptional regulator, arsenate/arsenite/antimonite-responsive transcriptional repressor
MESVTAAIALSALGHEGRLGIFRLLVRKGAEGMPAGEIAKAIGILPNTLSANLNILSQTHLITSRREGRSIIYSANYVAMSRLLGFLMEDCCGGNPMICAPLSQIVTKAVACDGTCLAELETA